MISLGGNWTLSRGLWRIWHNGSFHHKFKHVRLNRTGELTERPKVAVLKTAVSLVGTKGSNPLLSATSPARTKRGAFSICRATIWLQAGARSDSERWHFGRVHRATGLDNVSLGIQTGIQTGIHFCLDTGVQTAESVKCAALFELKLNEQLGLQGTGDVA